MRIRLDRTICDGFGVCAQHAPAYFSLDDWGYAALIGDGVVPDEDHDAVLRALMDCPVHAITSTTERRPDHPAPPDIVDAPEPHPAHGGEAEWGFVR